MEHMEGFSDPSESMIGEGGVQLPVEPHPLAVVLSSSLIIAPIAPTGPLFSQPAVNVQERLIDDLDRIKANALYGIVKENCEKNGNQFCTNVLKLLQSKKVKNALSFGKSGGVRGKKVAVALPDLIARFVVAYPQLIAIIAGDCEGERVIDKRQVAPTPKNPGVSAAAVAAAGARKKTPATKQTANKSLGCLAAADEDDLCRSVAMKEAVSGPLRDCTVYARTNYFASVSTLDIGDDAYKLLAPVDATLGLEDDEEGTHISINLDHFVAFINIQACIGCLLNDPSMDMQRQLAQLAQQAQLAQLA
ncbi:hypothetical protein T492DRAFT_887264 [Pavlovales sp. CCMP2436]|nr:hypothetical protein T492DRAFT_887264 [Pavlovales sp. CCMP2436]